MSVKSVRAVDVAIKADEVAKATSTASTLQELIGTIPRAYQALLGDHLTKKYRVAHKHANVQSTVALYNRHLIDGSFPPIIRNSLKEPKLQFAKEFLATTQGSSAPEVFQAEVLAARKAVLKAATTQKQSELALLATLVRPAEEDWKQACRNVASTAAASCGGRLVVNASSMCMEGVPPTAQSEFATMFGACQTYTYRVLALARASIDRADIQKLAKIQLKDATDVEMTDASKEPAVRDIIREEIQSLRKELSRSQGKPKKPALRVQKRQAPGKNAKKGGKKNLGRKTRK